MNLLNIVVMLVLGSIVGIVVLGLYLSRKYTAIVVIGICIVLFIIARVHVESRKITPLDQEVENQINTIWPGCFHQEQEIDKFLMPYGNRKFKVMLDCPVEESGKYPEVKMLESFPLIEGAQVISPILIEYIEKIQ